MTARPRVYLIDAAESPLCTEVELEKDILGDYADLVFLQTADSTDFPHDLYSADGLIVSHFPQITANVLQSFTKLQIVVRNGVGYDNVDTQAAQRLGIPVCNVP